jgi:Fe-S-cluster containining protein
MKLVNQLRDYFDPPQSGEVVYQHYVRTGECHQCGQCCAGIHLIHGDEVVSEIEQFERLKTQFPDYAYFEPIEQTEQGLMFRCRQLQPDNRCGVYADRPPFCKKYPSEATLLFGGALAPQCGFAFKARHRFADMLQKAADKKTLRPGRLLNEV